MDSRTVSVPKTVLFGGYKNDISINEHKLEMNSTTVLE